MYLYYYNTTTHHVKLNDIFSNTLQHIMPILNDLHSDTQSAAINQFDLIYYIM